MPRLSDECLATRWSMPHGFITKFGKFHWSDIALYRARCVLTIQHTHAISVQPTSSCLVGCSKPTENSTYLNQATVESSRPATDSVLRHTERCLSKYELQLRRFGNANRNTHYQQRSHEHSPSKVIVVLTVAKL